MKMVTMALKWLISLGLLYFGLYIAYGAALGWELKTSSSTHPRVTDAQIHKALQAQSHSFLQSKTYVKDQLSVSALKKWMDTHQNQIQMASRHIEQPLTLQPCVPSNTQLQSHTQARTHAHFNAALKQAPNFFVVTPKHQRWLNTHKRLFLQGHFEGFLVNGTPIEAKALRHSTGSPIVAVSCTGFEKSFGHQTLPFFVNDGWVHS